ncbi:MAG: type II toxin-antitoxin system ParD family antitoxin [Alistipes indistinctus]
MRAGLRLLEEQENKVVALKSAIDEGVNSGIAVGFDPQQHLRTLKTQRKNG